jgi:hypothetical protein
MSNTRRACALIAVALLAAVPAGCGGSDDGESGGAAQASDAAAGQEVRQAMRSLENALYAGDGKKYCAALTEVSASGSGVTGQSCEESVRELVPKPLAPSVIATVRSRIQRVEVDGDRATLYGRGADGGLDKAAFVNEDGGWKMDLKRSSGASGSKSPKS